MISRLQLITSLFLFFLPLTAKALPSKKPETIPNTKASALSPSQTKIQPDQYNIVVSGNTRTKTSYIKKIIDECIEDSDIKEFTGTDTETLKECILNSRHFSDAEVSFKDEQLSVKVTERWTLIPIPFVRSGRKGETRFGGAVFESNFLGYGKTIGVGGAYSKYHTNYYALFFDPSIFFTNWNLRLRAAKRDEEIVLFKREEEIDGLDESTQSINFSLGYKILPRLNCSALYINTTKKFSDFNNYLEPENYQVNSAGVNIRWNNSVFRFYFQEGLIVHLGFVNHFSGQDDIDKSFTISSRLSWQKKTFYDHALQIRIAAEHLEEANRRHALRVGRRNGFRGIPEEGAWVEGYLATAVDYQIPLWISSYGTLTAAPFLDIGYLRQAVDNIEDDSYVSSGLGLYYYLKRIAIPGIGIHVGHNNKYQDVFVEFAIGFAF